MALQAECWATGDGESYQGEKVLADWENDNGAKEEDYTEIKLCPFDSPRPSLSPSHNCTADISRNREA